MSNIDWKWNGRFPLKIAKLFVNTGRLFDYTATVIGHTARTVDYFSTVFEHTAWTFKSIATWFEGLKRTFNCIDRNQNRLYKRLLKYYISHYQTILPLFHPVSIINNAYKLLVWDRKVNTYSLKPYERNRITLRNSHDLLFATELSSSMKSIG